MALAKNAGIVQLSCEQLAINCLKEPSWASPPPESAGRDSGNARPEIFFSVTFGWMLRTSPRSVSSIF